MITSLITGGAGFIGSNISKYCLLLGHQVVIVDDLSGGFEDNLPDGVIFIKGSINEYELLEQIFSEYKIDFVYHLAAYAAEGLSHFIRRFNYANNLTGSINLVNLAVLHKIKCFVFTSSIAVYGSSQLPMKEDMTPKPEDPYGIAKYAVELDLFAANRMFGLNYMIFRPHNVYGENQNIADKYRNVIGIFMHQLMHNNHMTIFGDGEQTRAFSYIADVAPVIANSVNFREAYNEVFNIGANTRYTINCLAHLVAAEFDVVPSITYAEPRKEVQHAFSDHSKAIKYFGNLKQTGVKEGIRNMACWVKSTSARPITTFKAIEIMENLPNSWRT